MAHLEIPFAVGARVWYSEAHVDTAYEPCPDCAGTKTVTATLGCGLSLQLPCQTCSVGFSAPSGVVKRSVFTAIPQLVTLGNPTMYGEDIYYELDGGGKVRSSELHLWWPASKEQCLEMVRTRTLQYKDQLRRQLASKRRDLAWSVTYWRSKVKDLRRNLEIAEQALVISEAKKEKTV